MSFNYIITLTPLEPFFFGGEYTFGADDTRDESSRYSAISTHFPQQSAVLGMIRKTILIQNDCLTLHRRGEWVDNSRISKATSLVGRGQFSYDEAFDIGMIESLSPVFIAHSGKFYVANARDKNFTPRLSTATKMLIGDTEQSTIVFEGFDPKKYEEETFVSSNGDTVKKTSDFFGEVSNIGIKKAKNGGAEEDAFFQKNSFILKENASFAFIFTLSDEIKFAKTIVTLGADQSSFVLDIKPFDSSFNQLFSDCFDTKEIDRVILTSETLINQEVQDLALFILGKRKNFRFLKGEKNAPSKGRKSKRYFLLERGSVLYTADLGQLSSALSQTHLQRVGINHFITIKGAK
jgi:CRISPR-associated protein Cmr3